jgi:hypothetical protein
MRRHPWTARRALAAALVVAGASLPAAVSASAEHDDTAPPARLLHSSDGVRGPVARDADLLGSALGMAAPRVSLESRRVVPGVRYESWEEQSVRGEVVGHLLRVDNDAAGVRLNYASMATSRDRAPLTRLLSRTGRAVAGVNGDFFDIDDTGAPRGVAVRNGDALGGPSAGWVQSFSVLGARDPRIGVTQVWARVARRPALQFGGVNIPTVPPDRIVLYTPRWGEAAGRSVVGDAPPDRTHQVVVRDGRVVSSSRTLTSGHPVRGRLLVGRGTGAEQLRGLKLGTRVRISYGVKPIRTPQGSVVPRVAIGGNLQLVRDGVVVAHDDTEMHPRTAVGIDEDGGRILLVVIDGRSATSRGHTLLELAQLMVELGAESALNLDGGGSSTLAARRDGAIRVHNTPSDGTQRPVPNGIAVTYAAP